MQLRTVREQVPVGPGHAEAARGPQPQQASPRQRGPQPPVDVLQQRRSMLTTNRRPDVVVGVSLVLVQHTLHACELLQ